MTKINKIGIAFLVLLVLAGLISNIFAGETMINVNTATKQELMELKGIGPVLSGRIIDARPFAHIDSIRVRVKGIGLVKEVWMYKFVTVDSSVVTHIHQEGE